jgi:hypothetical protein
VNRDEFETSVLDLWMTTRIPLTRAHLQFRTGVARRKLNGWLDEMVAEGVLECDVDDDGEMLWTVPGAARAIDGPRSFAEAEKLAGLRAEVRRKVRERHENRSVASEALVLARQASGPPARVRPVDGDADVKQKSLLLSAGLSFFGPLGWLYAGSLREAIPAAALAVLITAVIPTFLLMPILWVAMPLSAIAGLIYAWQYNRSGQRTTIFLEDGKKGERDPD